MGTLPGAPVVRDLPCYLLGCRSLQRFHTQLSEATIPPRVLGAHKKEVYFFVLPRCFLHSRWWSFLGESNNNNSAHKGLICEPVVTRRNRRNHNAWVGSLTFFLFPEGAFTQVPKWSSEISLQLRCLGDTYWSPIMTNHGMWVNLHRYLFHCEYLVLWERERKYVARHNYVWPVLGLMQDLRCTHTKLIIWGFAILNKSDNSLWEPFYPQWFLHWHQSLGRSYFDI